ncbi:MAG: class I SAM-dependent methyltransferase [Planctomycetes bacterium]|nr:class I SAM-dependent methyltransferase [Planctomycetota bacterium]
MPEIPWWQAAFAAGYEQVYAHRNDAAAAAEITGLLPRLSRAPGAVLDAGCGNGRHLQALRAAGLSAFGFDLSPQLLASARIRTSCQGRLVRADMRVPPLAGGWGAIVLLFTAFGYFDDAANAALLRRLAGMLAPGGWLVLDLPEPVRLRAGLVAASERSGCDGLVIRERRRLVGSRVEKDVTMTRAGEVLTSWRESVRIYEAAEIAALAGAAGATLVETWPGLRGPVNDEGRHVHWLRR